VRRLTSNTFLTLDGVMQAPGGPVEDESGGFTYGGWSVPYWDEAAAERMGAYMTPPFDLVLGRRTYEIFASYWPEADAAYADVLNAATKHVASRTLTEVTWRNSHLLEGDVAAAVRALKEGDGPELQVHGSGDLLQTLLREDLMDEMQIFILPIVLGSGKRLFGSGTIPAAFELVSSGVSSTGVFMATYRRAGKVKTGTFADEG
jgi:dihydrofolate reductase